MRGSFVFLVSTPHKQGETGLTAQDWNKTKKYVKITLLVKLQTVYCQFPENLIPSFLENGEIPYMEIKWFDRLTIRKINSLMVRL